MIPASLPLALAGFALLALSMHRHARQATVRDTAGRLRLSRVAGWAALALSCAVHVTGPAWRIAIKPPFAPHGASPPLTFVRGHCLTTPGHRPAGSRSRGCLRFWILRGARAPMAALPAARLRSGEGSASLSSSAAG